MSSPFAFGVYRTDTSFAHGLDPRSKIIFTLLFLLLCMIADTPFELIGIALVALIMCRASGTRVSQAWRSLRPLVPLMVFVGFFDLFSVQGTVALFVIGPLTATREGLVFALSSLVKMSCALMGSANLMLSTDPTALADGCMMLAAPLHRLGFAVDDLAFAVQATFRFVPLLQEEYFRITQVRSEREAASGATARGFGLRVRVQDFAQVLTPLCRSVFSRAETLSAAAINRGYGQAVKRSCIRTYRLRSCDILVIVGALVVTVLYICC